MPDQSVRRIAPAAAGFLAAALAAGAEGTAAGVRWLVPKGWSEQAARPMRVATYNIPAARGSAAGECAVFYFGRGQGGSVEDNLSRWMRQFEKPRQPQRSERRVREFRVHTIDVTGTYLEPGGPMMQTERKFPGYRLLGAIVETPQGNVFFKSTGPAATIESARGDFDRMIDSVAKAALSV